jgi:hypothetical protein
MATVWTQRAFSMWRKDIGRSPRPPRHPPRLAFEVRTPYGESNKPKGIVYPVANANNESLHDTLFYR